MNPENKPADIPTSVDVVRRADGKYAVRIEIGDYDSAGHAENAALTYGPAFGQWFSDFYWGMFPHGKEGPKE